MAHPCFSGAPIHEFTECDPCFERYFTIEGYVQEPHPDPNITFPITCYVTRKYRWKMCYKGIAVGKHVYSITLLPGEEVEIEVIRREKFSYALSQQESVEETFETEVRSKLVTETSSIEDINAKFSHEGNVNILIFKAKDKIAFDVTTKSIEKKLNEVVEKAAASVSKSYDTSIDVKTEVENQYRSLRRMKNPNPCQPVTFHFYQLMKSYKRELFLIEQTYDCFNPAGIGVEPGMVSFVSQPRTAAVQTPNIVTPPPAWTLGDNMKAPLGCIEQARSSDQFETSTTQQFARPVTKQFTNARPPRQEGRRGNPSRSQAH
jgi:hypothetical protein